MTWNSRQTRKEQPDPQGHLSEQLRWGPNDPAGRRGGLGGVPLDASEASCSPAVLTGAYPHTLCHRAGYNQLASTLNDPSLSLPHPHPTFCTKKTEIRCSFWLCGQSCAAQAPPGNLCSALALA